MAAPDVALHIDLHSAAPTHPAWAAYEADSDLLDDDAFEQAILESRRQARAAADHVTAA